MKNAGISFLSGILIFIISNIFGILLPMLAISVIGIFSLPIVLHVVLEKGKIETAKKISIFSYGLWGFIVMFMTMLDNSTH